MTPDDALRSADAETTKAEKLISVVTAAARLGRHPETVRRWIRNGQLQAVQFPSGQFMLAESTIQKILTPHHIL